MMNDNKLLRIQKHNEKVIEGENLVLKSNSFNILQRITHY